MGEYARYRGEPVKIGTCESMYYLRAEQRHDVKAMPGSLDPVKHAGAIRFRFPWPDEDGTPPGGEGFSDYDRSVCVPGYSCPEGINHGTVQFRASPGYLVSLPCPESPAWQADRLVGARDIRVARNGYRGAVHLVQQKLVAGVGLVPVLRCGGCGSAWRVEDRHSIEEIAVAFRSEADRRKLAAERHPEYDPELDTTGDWWHAVADRILAGIAAEATA